MMILTINHIDLDNMKSFRQGTASSGLGTQRILLMVAIGEWSVWDDDDDGDHYEDLDL